MKNRLDQQISFIREIDKLKNVFRRTYLLDESRLENTAEHSWHVSLAVLLLAEYGPPQMDLLRLVKMMLLHDIIEIDAGDTFLYDESGNKDKAERELRAADRLFHLLPKDQADEYRALWNEFEERGTPEAKFARGLDRLLPLLQNYFTEGSTWRRHGVSSDMVFKHNLIIADASPELWQFAKGLIEDAIEKNYIQK